MGVYLYNISITNVSTEIRNQNKLILKKTVNDMDTSFKTMDVLSGQVVANSNITQLANKPDNSENSFFLLAYHAKEDLSVYLFTESILPIKNYYIYLSQSGYILSLSQFSHSQLYYRGIKNYYFDKYEKWIAMLNNPSLYRHFTPIDDYKKYSDSTYLYMLPLTEYSLKEVPAVICFEIDYKQLKNIFSELSFYETGYLCVADSAGNLVFTIKGNQANEISTQTLSNLNYTSDFSTYSDTESSEDLFVTRASSKYNQWSYFLVQPEDTSLYSLKQYRNIFIGIILFGLFVEVVMILFLSRTNIKKITQLGNELDDTQSQQSILQKLVEVQKPIIVDTYLSKIMRGDISTQQELDYAQQYVNISTQDRKFSVIFMVAYVNQYELHDDTSVVIGPDNLNYKEIIQQAIHDFFTDAVAVMSNNEKEFSILLSTPAEDTNELSTENVKASFSALHNYLVTNHSIWTFSGLGNWNVGLMITWKSFQQASQSISYATKKNPFSCYADIKKDTNGFYYPPELTNQLTNFVNAGNQSQVLEIFDIIRHENMEQRSLPINIMNFLLSDIRNTLYKIRFALNLSEENAASLRSIDVLFEDRMSLKLCEDIAIHLCQFFDSKTSGNKLIATIRNYIDENYHDPSLCLSKISDEFSISESYFSFLFKDEMDENFSNYLESKRINHARELIISTDMNLTDIYKEVGYNNAHTFRRVFKKTFGVSPKDARYQARGI